MKKPEKKIKTAAKEQRQMQITSSDVYWYCLMTLRTCIRCVHQCESCPNASDVQHQACVVTLKNCILACAICSADCDTGGATAAQCVAACRACVIACQVCDAACSAMNCSECNDACEACESACDTCLTICALNAGDVPPTDAEDLAEGAGAMSADMTMNSARSEQRSRPGQTSEVKMRVDARGCEIRNFEVRLKASGGKLIGYASVFDQPSLDLGGFREVFKHGAFAEEIAGGADVRALWQHDPNYVLGRIKSNTLSLSEDAHGLRVEITPPDTQWARDARTTIERGDVDQMSFAFKVPQPSDEIWSMEGGQVTRTVSRVQLFDVSPVTFPAYPQTTIEARSIAIEGQPSPLKGEEGMDESNSQARKTHARYRLELAEKTLTGGQS